MAKFGDRRSKKGREEAALLAVFTFFFRIVGWVFRCIFKVLWSSAKFVFHVLTLGKFRQKNVE